ncbi:2-oxo acid dehydrogenase subunit E2 [Alcaligenaceae bacterium]|nr:2-oxo acid dehydrogenase subunit E2 [Alcaligenaceae bacterium]
MMVDILMPGVGAGTTHGKIIQWFKRTGETVSVGDVLAEIETDKAVIELEAFDEGVLSEILVQAGDQEVAVGERVAVLATGDGEDGDAGDAGDAGGAPAAAPARQESASGKPSAPGAPATGTVAETPSGLDRVFASPSARRLARELDIDLNSLQGSGPRGRVVRIDIERAHALSAGATGREPVAAPGVAPRAAPLAVDRTAPDTPADADADADADAVSVPHSAMRKTIARRLQESKQQLPHFYLTVDIEMGRLMKLRRKLNDMLAASGDPLRLSLNDMLTHLVGMAVARCPDINVRWTPDALLRNPSVDVAVAVATGKGLITPIVRDVAGKRLGQVARELGAKVERARDGRLAPADYEGGSVTLSNLGMHGVREFSAIINPPQVAIIAVGAVEERPIVKKGKLKAAHMMSATLSADHRAVDGELGARFLAVLKESIERPLMSLL